MELFLFVNVILIFFLLVRVNIKFVIFGGCGVLKVRLIVIGVIDLGIERIFKDENILVVSIVVGKLEIVILMMDGEVFSMVLV